MFVKIDEEVTVLSEELVDVVPVPAEVYSPSSSSRPEYVPSRATITRRNQQTQREEEEDAVNKGCYYFMACLDTFWIL